MSRANFSTREHSKSFNKFVTKVRGTFEQNKIRNVGFELHIRFTEENTWSKVKYDPTDWRLMYEGKANMNRTFLFNAR